MSKYSDEELAMLSEHERAALLEDDDDEGGDDGNPASQSDDVAALTDDTAKPNATDDDAAADAAKGDADDAGAATDAEKTDGATNDADDDDAEDEPFQPSYQAELPADFDEKIQAIDTQIADLEQKYADGEFNFAEFRKQERALLDERQGLSDLRVKAEIAQESAEQAARQRWQWEVNRFKRDTKRAEGIDYDNDKKLSADLDLMVKALAADPDNESRDGEWFLAEAHKRVKALRGIGTSDKPRADADPVKAVKDARQVKRPDKSLADLPAASRTDASIGEGEFSHLAKLSGLALEKAVAKLTPEQQDRWLQES